jgi:hypothetical protein
MMVNDMAAAARIEGYIPRAWPNKVMQNVRAGADYEGKLF